MTISPTIREMFVNRCNPHCIAWARATASLWGMSDDHDLDEPVQLSEGMPVRIRYAIDGELINMHFDRDLHLKPNRAGHHVFVRFALKNAAMYAEMEVKPSVVRMSETVNVTRY